MARLNSDGRADTNGKDFKVNIAGDFTNKGIDIEPTEPSFEDELPRSERENQNQDALEAGKKLVNPVVDFPLDE